MSLVSSVQRSLPCAQACEEGIGSSQSEDAAAGGRGRNNSSGEVTGGVAMGDTITHEDGELPMAEGTAQGAYGASQVGPFDYCPKLGFREYWYPAIEARQVRHRPVYLKM